MKKIICSIIIFSLYGCCHMPTNKVSYDKTSFDPPITWVDPAPGAEFIDSKNYEEQIENFDINQKFPPIYPE